MSKSKQRQVRIPREDISGWPNVPFRKDGKWQTKLGTFLTEPAALAFVAAANAKGVNHPTSTK